MSLGPPLSSAEAAVLAMQKGGDLRGAQVCVLTGVTYRQLDYWARTGLVVPSVAEARGSGTQRRYSVDDLHRVIALRRILDSGLSLMRARAALPMIREAQAEGLRWLVIGTEIVACAEEALGEVVSSMKVCTVIDVGEEAFQLSA